LGPAAGKRAEITGIAVERFSGGKAAEGWDDFDALGTMRQLGMVPEPSRPKES
jgi:hypothetical protein